MTLGYTSPLCPLPFDHRHSYVTGMFQFTAPLTADEHNTVAESKRVIYDGFRQALSESCRAPVPGSSSTKNSARAFSAMQSGGDT